jgi:4-hydroxy 2-oxovalerate aldolase
MVRIHDVTLRDGNHACGHSINPELVRRYCDLAIKAGVDELEVGHGNGLGASTLQVGQAKHPDSHNVCLAAETLNGSRVKLCVFMIPGWGTLDHLESVLAYKPDIVRVGCHCTEADTTKRYIEYAVSKHVEAHGVLMMSHMANEHQIVEESRKMRSYGAKAVIVMDSAGTLTPRQVELCIRELSADGPTGFHAHNNLGLAVANSLVAVDAEIIDCSSRGFGAGAGNAPLELVAAAFQRAGITTNLNLDAVLALGDFMDAEIPKLGAKRPESDTSSILSGLYGVFSGFKPHVNAAVATYGVEEKLIWQGLARRGAVAGQEDLVIDVAREIMNKKEW